MTFSNATTPATPAIIRYMDDRLDHCLSEVLRSHYWQAFIDDSRSDQDRLLMFAYVMADVGHYQHQVNRAVFTAVGRLGRYIEEQALIRSLIAVQIEEVGHGSLALQDVEALLGTQPTTLSPPATCLVGLVRHLGEEAHPLTHLGYMYFFEKFTTMITPHVLPLLLAAGYPQDRLSFMHLHAEEDLRHTDMLLQSILHVLRRYDDADQHIQHGFDAFAQLYPHPLWSYACARAAADQSTPSDRVLIPQPCA
jgi:hypothetical protein